MPTKTKKIYSYDGAIEFIKEVFKVSENLILERISKSEQLRFISLKGSTFSFIEKKPIFFSRQFYFLIKQNPITLFQLEITTANKKKTPVFLCGWKEFQNGCQKYNLMIIKKMSPDSHIVTGPTGCCMTNGRKSFHAGAL